MSDIPLCPIFLISFNRSFMLEYVVEGIRKLGDYPIIIHDNGSTDKKTIETLTKLENQPNITVNRFEKINSADDLVNVNRSISLYFTNHPQSDYVVSDCDIDIRNFRSDWLKVYRYLLEKYPSLESVACMLRIRDVRHRYEGRVRMMNRFIREFWGRMPVIEDLPPGFEVKQVAYLHGKVDTTFALHRAGSTFRRLTKTMRVYAPYEGIHMDWYPKFASYHNSNVNNISHWGNKKYIDFHKPLSKMENQFYWDIKVQEDNTLAIVKRDTSKVYP